MRAEPRPVPTSLWACLGRGFGVQWERVLLPGDSPRKPLAPTSTGVWPRRGPSSQRFGAWFLTALGGRSTLSPRTSRRLPCPGWSPG